MNKNLRTLWYMGVKTRLVPDFIEGAVGDLISPGDTVLDLCTGTAVVGRALAAHYRVYANDVQRFSSVVASAYLVGGASWTVTLEVLDPDRDLSTAFKKNLARLSELAPNALEGEDRLLPAVLRELAARDAGDSTEEYRDLLSQAPLSHEEASTSTSRWYQPLAEQYGALLSERRENNAARPYALMTLYYQGVYFGLRQSMVIDSLRAAIDAIPGSDPNAERKRDLYLAALVQACSTSTSGTSHFAQPRAVSRDPELLAVARRRSIDIELEFHRVLDTIRREWGGNPRFSTDNRVFNGEASQLLGPDGPLEPGEVNLVYLDPPYTADHYSRFYHVLETLVSYDYPELERRGDHLTKGRYPVREHRFLSDFCSRERVEGEFRKIIEACANLGAKLLVSYSLDSGLLFKRWRVGAKDGDLSPELRFLELFRDYYPTVEFRQRELMHSGQGDSNHTVREVLVLCDTE